jgi:hypothetical protein
MMSVLSQDAWKYAEGDPRRDLFPSKWDNELPPKEWQSILLPQGGEKGNPKNITGN